MNPGRTKPSRREAVLLYAVVLVLFFVGTWALDRYSGKRFDATSAAIMGACLVAGWWSARRIVQLLDKRQRS